MNRDKSKQIDSLLQINQINFSKLPQGKFHPIVKLVSSNNVIAFGRSDFSLTIANVNNDTVNSFKIIDNIPHRSDDTFENLFVDISGRHLIFTTALGESFYLNCTTFKYSKLSRWQGSLESVAFGREIEGETELRPFLVGTTAGMIYEINIDKTTAQERSRHVVLQLEQPLAITSIFFDYLGHSNNSDSIRFAPNEWRRLYVLFATSSPTRLYHCYTVQFSTFKALFSQSSASAGGISTQFSSFSSSNLSHIELPGDINRAVLHCYGDHSNNSQSFALMTESGIYHGSITCPNNRTDEVSVEAQLLPYSTSAAYQPHSSQSMSYGYRSNVPISIAPSIYHFMVLSVEKHIQIVNKLNGETIQDLNPQVLLQSSTGASSINSATVASTLNRAGRTETPLGFVSDQLTQSVYLFTDSAVHKVRLHDEDRHNWRIYLKKALATGEEVAFDYALKHCKSKEDKLAVLRAKTEYMFLRRDIKQACKQLGTSTSIITFDEAVLRILGVSPLLLDAEIHESLALTQQHEKQLQTSRNENVHDTSHSAHKSYYGTQLVNMYGLIESILLETDINQTQLRVYLQEVLSHLPGTSKSQRTMVATWICEIFIHELTTKAMCDTIENIKTNKKIELKSNIKDVTEATSSYLLNEEKMSLWEYFLLHVPSFRESVMDLDGALLEDEFKEFLSNNRGVLDRAVTFTQLLSRGNTLIQQGILLYYAQTISDYERVIAQLVGEMKYTEAINLLHNALLENVENLIYKWSPLLIQSKPSLTVDMLVAKPKLKAHLVLPALLRYCDMYDKVNEPQLSQKPNAGSSNSSAAAASKAAATGSAASISKGVKETKVVTHYAIVYLQSYFHHCQEQATISYSEDNTNIFIRSGSDASLYHSYIYMLCKYDQSDETNLLAALQLEIDVTNEPLPLQPTLLNGCIDFDFVLRQCQNFKRKKGIVYSYMLINLLEEAVEAALTIDIAFAKAIAKRHTDYAARKKMWLKVAIYVINGEKRPQKALQLIKESDGALLVQDVLPHLPDFTEIDAFRDDICAALEVCSGHLDALKLEMQELSDSSMTINKELEEMRQKGYPLAAHQRCEYCDDLLFARQFYLFPCTHGYHTDCLLQRIYSHRHLEPSQLAAVSKIEEEIRSLRSRSIENDKRSQVKLEYLQSELDGYIAADCPLCGVVMIRSLAVSLLEGESETEVESWRL